MTDDLDNWSKAHELTQNEHVKARLFELKTPRRKENKMMNLHRTKMVKHRRVICI
jgi:hypothetical protein